MKKIVKHVDELAGQFGLGLVSDYYLIDHFILSHFTLVW